MRRGLAAAAIGPAVAGLLLASPMPPAAGQEAQPPITRVAYLMGTRAELAAYAPTRAAGLARLESALRILEETERELSTWRPESDLSRLNRQPVGQEWQASPRTCRLLAALIAWHETTLGLFDPGIGRLLNAWDVHGRGAVPDARSLARARAASGLSLLSFDRDRCVAIRRADILLDAGAFGKGEALDRVDRALADVPWMIDLGGQVSVGGPPPPGGPWRLDIAHPRDRGRALLSVGITNGSLATSGGSERDAKVAGVRVGHILDPRTGRPAAFDGSVSVWHRLSLAADVLSTALYVMGPADGLRWANDRQLAVCYLIPEGQDVRVETTPAFRRLLR